MEQVLQSAGLLFKCLPWQLTMGVGNLYNLYNSYLDCGILKGMSHCHCLPASLLAGSWREKGSWGWKLAPVPSP